MLYVLYVLLTVLSVIPAFVNVFFTISVNVSLKILAMWLDLWSSKEYSPTRALNFHNSLLICCDAPLKAYHLLTGLIYVNIPVINVVKIVVVINNNEVISPMTVD